MIDKELTIQSKKVQTTEHYDLSFCCRNILPKEVAL